MSDDPFAEPEDNERTLIRPRPRAAASAPLARTEAPPGAAGAVPQVGINPLLAAAAPLLAAAIHLAGARGRHPDPDQLRRSMVAAVREFETKALATGLDTKSLRAARYALCATIDDLVFSTPWGASSSWATQSLTSIFHNEVSGGERFFEILEQMQKDLGRHGEVVELMYIATSLGFEGRYRVMPRGIAALTELRDSVYRMIRNRRGEFERDLSPHWRGLPAALRPISQRVPLWALGLGTLGVACLIYLLFNFSLAGRSDVAFTQLTALPPQSAMLVAHAVATPAATPRPPPPAPAPSDIASKLRTFLAPEIKEGLVAVFEDAQSVTVRLTNRNMFASGAADLSASYGPLLQRIGDALQGETGEVLVQGYTDNQPIRTVRFPSNFQLSQARAEAVARQLAARLSDPKRVHAEGKADASPIAPNTTADGRQQNRRTEIVLVRTASSP